MASGHDGRADVDLGEPHQGSQSGGADPKKSSTAIRGNRLTVGRNDNKAEPWDNSKDRK
jgi:hypothetical protein